VSAPIPNPAADALTGLRAAAEPQLPIRWPTPTRCRWRWRLRRRPLRDVDGSAQRADPEHDDDATTYTEVVAPVHQRMILMGSAVAFLIVSFATLAVTVAINVRPAASTSDLASPRFSPTRCLAAICHRFRTSPTRWLSRSPC